MILLDTDIIIDVLRNHQKAITTFNDRHHQMFIIPPIMLELLTGARNKAEADLILQKFDLPVLELDDGIWQRSYDIIIKYGFSYGTGIVDSIVAATALEYDFELWSRNSSQHARSRKCGFFAGP